MDESVTLLKPATLPTQTVKRFVTFTAKCENKH